MSEPDLNSTPHSDEQSALASLRLVDGEFRRVDDAAEQEAEDERTRERVREAVARVATPERLHKLMLMVYRRAGRTLKVQSLEIDPADPDFREACDLLHDDLKDSVLGPLLDRLSSDAIERIIVYGVGFGGPVVGAYREIEARKREAKPDATGAEPVSVDVEVSDDDE